MSYIFIVFGKVRLEESIQFGERTFLLQSLQNRYYDLILSTRVGGLGHALFLFMSSSRDKVGYVYPDVNSVGAGLFLNEMFKASSSNLSEGGYHM
jgi:hypothetical protein